MMRTVRQHKGHNATEQQGRRVYLILLRTVSAYVELLHLHFFFFKLAHYFECFVLKLT